nr:hypothetical protein [Paenibacillus bovis]
MRLQLNFAILIGLIFILMLPEISYAHHPYSPKRHMTSTHSTINHEYFCADVKESSVSISSAYNELKRILYNRNYDGLAGNKIYLVASNTNLNCSDMWGSVRKMRIYNAKHIFETIPPFLTTLRKFQWS